MNRHAPVIGCRLSISMNDLLGAHKQGTMTLAHMLLNTNSRFREKSATVSIAFSNNSSFETGRHVLCAGAFQTQGEAELVSFAVKQATRRARRLVCPRHHLMCFAHQCPRARTLHFWPRAVEH